MKPYEKYGETFWTLAILAMMAWAALTAGCSGFHPLQDAPAPLPIASTPYFDATTPHQYGTGWNSGILDEITGSDGLVFVITRDRAAREKALGHVSKPYLDRYSNHVFTLAVGVITSEFSDKENAGVKRLEGAK